MKSEIYIEAYKVSPITFSGGERHLAIPENLPKRVGIGAVIRDSDGIMDLLLIADALRRSDREIYELTIPYLPYARQDRVCNDGEPHSLAVMAGLINSVGAEKVFVLDAHSTVAEAVIDNLVDVSVLDIFKNFGFDLSKEYDVLIAPDAGAEKKVFKLGQFFGLPVEVARKVRDTKTGEIVKTVFHSETDLTDKRVLVVDDICDGGRTFIELAKVLPRTSQLDLYVTHGIFSKGLEPLLDYFDKVFSCSLDAKRQMKITEKTP